MGKRSRVESPSRVAWYRRRSARVGSKPSGSMVVHVARGCLDHVAARSKSWFGRLLRQAALWWSLPWGAGLCAAGVLPTKALRAAALSSVAISVAVTVGCAPAAPIHGFGLRLPYGFDSPLLRYAKPGPPAGQPRTVRRVVTTDARSAA